MEDFVSKLNSVVSTVWLTGNKTSEENDSRNQVCDSAVKVQTIHSAKGLQYRIVIVLWGGTLPFDYGDRTLLGDTKLMYVALTRAEELLAVSYSGDSDFISNIEASGKAKSLSCSRSDSPYYYDSLLASRGQ